MSMSLRYPVLLPMLAALPISLIFAQDNISRVSGHAVIHHSTTNLKVDTVDPREGGQISVDYVWELSTLFGEPIQKCNAAWTLDAVYVKKTATDGVRYISVKNMPPKVAASVQIIDLEINATSPYFKTSFNCDTGVTAAQGKERSWNFPTSPDWHEIFHAFPSNSKEQAAKENKAKFKAMLGNADAVARLYDYSVNKVNFDLSGVREWLIDQDDKSAKKLARKVDSEIAIVTSPLREDLFGEKTLAQSAIDNKKNKVNASRIKYEEKIRGLHQKNWIAGVWKGDEREWTIEVQSIENWGADGGVATIKAESKKWNGPKRDQKIRKIKSLTQNKFSCEELWSYWKGDEFSKFAWVECNIAVNNKSEFLLTATDGKKTESTLFRRIE